MEIKTIVRNCIVIAVLIIVFFLLQVSVFSHFELAGVTPNLMIIITSSFSFMRGKKEGLFVGFFCGLLLDIFLGSYVGLYAMMYMFIGYLNGMFRSMFFGEDVKLPLFLIGTSDLFYNIVVYFMLFLLRQQYSFFFYLKNIMLPEMIYTILVSFLFYYVILKANQWLDGFEKRSKKGFV